MVFIIVMHPILLPLRLPARLLPASLQDTAAALIANHLLRGQAIVERLPELEGKVIALHVTDLGLDLHFEVGAGRLHAATGRTPHVAIRGGLEDLWRLAAGREDPDTLFFARRLSVEGETETGLLLKNLLDGLEFDPNAHVHAVLPPPLAGMAEQVLSAVRRPPGRP